MKIYTRTGDGGTTALATGQRLPKQAPRIEAYGTIDELNSWLGVLAAHADCPEATRPLLLRMQSLLFNIGGHLAGVPQAGIEPQHIATLEADIDRMTAQLPPLREFILPGGSPLAAWANVARTVCRRAERRMLAAEMEVSPPALTYINRLSDWLFTFGRYANIGRPEPKWEK